MGYSDVSSLATGNMKIILLANTDWYLYNFRLPLALALKKRGDSVLLMSPAGDYAEKMVTLGFQWHEFKLDRSGINPFAEALSLLRLWKYYRQEQPDLVHHFTIKPVLYGSMAALLAGVPIIINSVTGLGYVFAGNVNGLRFIISQFYRLLLRHTWVIFQNPDDQSVFTSKRLVDAKRVKLIRSSGVDTILFQPAQEPESVPIVILPARLLWDKGVGEFVEAATILKKRGVSARFVLVGDTDPGNPSAVPLKSIQEWQKQNLVEWWGWQENIVEIYHQATLVCLPSYREGLPKTLIEAAACGRAIVTTDVPGCREIVRQGENGLIVPAKDSVALADALQTLLENPVLRQTMAENGRRIAVNEFDVRQVVQSTIELYNHAQTSLLGTYAS
jgi:glycosyltransferase involved in cell wall biosynthesis